MKKNKFVKFSAATVLALSAITPVAAFASETEVTPDGFYTGSGYVTMAEFAAMSKSEKKALLIENIGSGALVLVQNGQVYDMTDSNIQNAPADEVEGLGKTVEEYTEETGNELTPEGIVEPEGELTVTSVSAINQTIAKSTNVELKFNVNGDEYTKASFDEKFGEEGYTVEFKYNFSANATEKAGTVNKSGDFKYAVEVSQDGEKFNSATSADFVEVKVVDKDVATSVQAVQLKTSAGEWESSTVSALDEVEIVASEYTNALGQSNLDKDENDTPVVPGLAAPTVEKVTSSDVTVAYYDLNSDKIVVLADGEVTFTVKFEDIKETKTITVQAVATQEVTAISADAQKVKAETAGQTVTFTVLDQNNEAVRVDETEVFYTLTKSGDVEADAAVSVKTDATGKASVGVNKVAGDYTVNVYTKDDKKTKIGSFAVEAINVDAEAVIDSYELSFADEDITSVDLNPGKLDDGANTLTVNAKASISGINVDLPANVKVKSSDDKILTAVEADDLAADGEITVTGVKSGKANVVLYTEEGDLVTTLATLEVEVVNTATQFTTLTLKPDTKVDGKAADLEQAVIDAVKEEVTKEQIASVTPLKADGKVLVKFEAEYGGKTISLDATFADTTLTKADAVIVKTADTEAKNAVATTTSALVVSSIADGGTIVVDSETYTVSTSFDLDALNVAIASTGVVATGTEAALVLTKADGTDFTYSATTDGSDELFGSTDVTNGEEAVDAIVGEAQSGTITLTFSEAVNVEAATEININGTIAGTVATAVEGEKTVTITLDATNAKKVANVAVTVLDLKAINGSDIVLPENDAAVKITVVTTVDTP